jgi:hypothetical protein
MKKMSLVLALVVFVAALYQTSFAATEYVFADENGYLSNGLIVFELDSATGALTQIARLATGGKGLGSRFSTNLGNIQQVVSPGAACIFAVDAVSSDIAAFSKAQGYARVGNYSNSSLSIGSALAIGPNGKSLYSSYSGTGNIGAWVVNGDCSLTFVGAYLPSGGGVVGPIKVTPNGAYLIAPLLVSFGGAETFSVDPNTGGLTDIGFLSFGTLAPCSNAGGCIPAGLDFTKDSRIVIISSFYIDSQNVEVPIAFSARLSNGPLGQLRAWSLYNSSNVSGNNLPFFSASGYAGSGNLFFGMDNGVVTANFTENPLKISVTSAIDFPSIIGGGIAVTGNLLIQAVYPNQISVFLINSDGSLTPLTTTQLDYSDIGLFSLSVFPETR